jgi:1,2-diacylglycerol 3-beta-galactosyltransferase
MWAMTPARLLFLVAETGGGHLAAARAVDHALQQAFPGRFETVLHDPLPRWFTGLYGPVVRFAPWLWGAAYHGCDSRTGVAGLLKLADRSVADAVARHKPAAIVSFHPLTGKAAARHGRPTATVVTDLVTVHTAWRCGEVDRIVLASQAGLPVAPAFTESAPVDRGALRRRLGVPGHGFLVLLTGGGEGTGGLKRRALALLQRFPDVDVAVLCGRNDRLRRTLTAQVGRWDGRLTVRGFVDNMADWLRCADVAVGKAGPATIAEAACCAVPLVLTGHLPGQEKGNTELVVAAGAGVGAPDVPRLIAEIDRLRRDPAAIDAMRAASARLASPGAAADVAAMVAGLVAPVAITTS